MEEIPDILSCCSLLAILLPRPDRGSKGMHPASDGGCMSLWEGCGD